MAHEPTGGETGFNEGQNPQDADEQAMASVVDWCKGNFNYLETTFPHVSLPGCRAAGFALVEVETKEGDSRQVYLQNMLDLKKRLDSYSKFSRFPIITGRYIEVKSVGEDDIELRATRDPSVIDDTTARLASNWAVSLFMPGRRKSDAQISLRRQTGAITINGFSMTLISDIDTLLEPIALEHPGSLPSGNTYVSQLKKLGVLLQDGLI